MEGAESGWGKVTCGLWIRRPEKANLVALGKPGSNDRPSSPSLIQILSFDPKTTSLASLPLATHELGASEGHPLTIAAHPSGDDIVFSTSSAGCKILELYGRESNLKLIARKPPLLQDIGPQQCLAFSSDGSRLAAGGLDGHLRIFKWPSLRVVLDEPAERSSYRDLDFSLDSELLASTSTDGWVRIWRAEDGVLLATLARCPDERFELCRFSRDGARPFLFCTVQKGDKALTGVWNISSWDRIGHKTLLGKPASAMSISFDGKYLALGGRDGDFCVVELKKMEICHWSKRLHSGTNISSLEFCPTERVILSTSSECGASATKLNVPAEWKDWQLYGILLGLFLASAVAHYIFYKNSDSFWDLPEE
ncbi:SEC12-like protein 1 [Rhodamnia argentea]|uniref:SEC12-like protein 1 n=1 Tax=Rhodamnia argentea TaxID=178133 RepID=A0A8B8QTD8_9MYRT|nr:SEC12-like protein 1 [Rhodamnia argentea]